MAPEPARRRSSFPHAPALDGVRGLAIVLVVILHLRLLVPSVGDRFEGGYIGVDLFLVLSGFLITNLLLHEHARTGSISYRRFYARRARRLLPALMVMLAAHAAYAAAVGRDLGREARSVAAALLYVLNWVAAAGHPIALGLGHLWSLSVEAQFYLLAPLTIAAVLHWAWLRDHALALVVTLTAGLAVWTAIVWDPGLDAFTVTPIYVRTDTHGVPVVCGAGASLVWWRFRPPMSVVRPLAAAGLALTGVCAWTLPVTSAAYYRGGMALIGLAAAVVVLCAADGGGVLAGALCWAPLRVLGRVSYGLYLWHVPIILEVSRRTGGRPAAVKVTVALSLTAAVTAASWHLVEAPILRRGRRASP